MDLPGRPHKESCLLYSGMNGSEGHSLWLTKPLNNSLLLVWFLYFKARRWDWADTLSGAVIILFYQVSEETEGNVIVGNAVPYDLFISLVVQVNSCKMKLCVLSV